MDFDKSNTLVILIHGFCRGAADMQIWKSCLQKEYANILTPDLPTKYSSFQTCIDKLSQIISGTHPEKYNNILIAGHSMGGLIAREYLQQNRQLKVRRLVCAGTPHYGSKLADIALKIPGTGDIWKPLHALKSSAREILTSPQIPGLEIGAIVSRNNKFLPGKLFLPAPADGFVELFSAAPPDAKYITEVPVDHVKMQYDPQTAVLIKKFFLYGKFD